MKSNYQMAQTAQRFLLMDKLDVANEEIAKLKALLEKCQCSN